MLKVHVHMKNGIKRCSVSVSMLSFSLPPGGQYCCASLHMSDFWLV